eukprot:SM000049S16724  [mRNA]  locus=s49:284500:286354:+ [translate_table: standard]
MLIAYDSAAAQWYPGHIARAERELREQLRHVDVVLEVRDARIPLATAHPEIDAWIGQRPKVVILNRSDMVSAADRGAWAAYHAALHGAGPLFTDSQHGEASSSPPPDQSPSLSLLPPPSSPLFPLTALSAASRGILRVARQALAVAKDINARRRAKGLLPRSVRAAVVGYPNVGKSALINRLVKRRACDSAPRPGVTRNLQWVRVAEGLDLLDAPGVLPARIADQAAAARLAICGDIGEAAYAAAGVGALLFEMLKRLPAAGPALLENQYRICGDGLSGEQFLELLAERTFQGDVDQAARRLLKDFRRGALGRLALERPPLPLPRPAR